MSHPARFTPNTLQSARQPQASECSLVLVNAHVPSPVPGHLNTAEKCCKYLQGIHNRCCELGSRGQVLSRRETVRLCPADYDRVANASIGARDVEAGPNAALPPTLGSGLHFLPHCYVLTDRPPSGTPSSSTACIALSSSVLLHA